MEWEIPVPLLLMAEIILAEKNGWICEDPVAAEKSEGEFLTKLRSLGWSPA